MGNKNTLVVTFYRPDGTYVWIGDLNDPPAQVRHGTFYALSEYAAKGERVDVSPGYLKTWYIAVISNGNVSRVQGDAWRRCFRGPSG